MTSDLIVAGAGGARVSDGNGLKSWCGGREQLWFLGDLPSPQPSPAGGRGSKTAGEHRDQRLNSFPRWGKAGMGAAHRPASNAVAPTPTLPQRRREPIHAARSSGAEQAQAERSDGPKGLPHRSGRAEKRRAWGGRGSAACRASCSDLLRMFERRERSEQSEFRSEAEGHGQWGRLFLWLLSFWRDKKKVTAPPGAHPGQRRILNTLPIR